MLAFRGKGVCVTGGLVETTTVQIRIERTQQGGVQAGIALWGATQFGACERARKSGLVVLCGQPIGAGGFDRLVGSALTIPVVALVVELADLHLGGIYAARTAERGLVRRVFTDPKAAAAWAAARARALRLARCQPVLSPELQVRRLSLSSPALQFRPTGQPSRQPAANR